MAHPPGVSAHVFLIRWYILTVTFRIPAQPGTIASLRQRSRHRFVFVVCCTITRIFVYQHNILPLYHCIITLLLVFSFVRSHRLSFLIVHHTVTLTYRIHAQPITTATLYQRSSCRLFPILYHTDTLIFRIQTQPSTTAMLYQQSPASSFASSIILSYWHSESENKPLWSDHSYKPHTHRAHTPTWFALSLLWDPLMTVATQA